MWLSCTGQEARLREREGGPGSKRAARLRGSGSRRGRSSQRATWHNFTGGGGVCKAALGQHGVFLGVSEPRARTESWDSVSSGWGRMQRQNCRPKCGWAGSHQKWVKCACGATVSTLVAPWSHLNSFKDIGPYPQKFRRSWFGL